MTRQETFVFLVIALRHLAWLTALRHTIRQERPWEHSLKRRTNREWSKKIGIREHNHTVEEELGDSPKDRSSCLESGLLNARHRRLQGTPDRVRLWLRAGLDT